jgi:hypothetical protein
MKSQDIINTLREWATKENDISLGFYQSNPFAPGEVVVWGLLLDKLNELETQLNNSLDGHT